MLAEKTIGALITHKPGIRGGRPVIAETGTTVRTVAIMYRQ